MRRSRSIASGREHRPVEPFSRELLPVSASVRGSVRYHRCRTGGHSRHGSRGKRATLRPPAGFPATMDRVHETFSPERLFAEARWIRRLARGLVDDDPSADDLVQDAWVAALTHPPREAGDERSLRAWLATVVRNLAARSRRGPDRRRLAQRPRRGPRSPPRPRDDRPAASGPAPRARDRVRGARRRPAAARALRGRRSRRVRPRARPRRRSCRRALRRGHAARAHPPRRERGAGRRARPLTRLQWPPRVPRNARESAALRGSIPT